MKKLTSKSLLMYLSYISVWYHLLVTNKWASHFHAQQIATGKSAINEMHTF